jgi:hypothetical protein
MMIRKVALVVVFASMGLMLSVPSHAGAVKVGGTWYYFSLDFETLIKSLTGKDVKDGTFVGAEVKITSADSACANPQGKVIAGEGPGTTVSGTSPNVNDNNLVKDDRVKGNVYQTTATILNIVPEDQRLNPPAGICKDAPGTSAWAPLFWQDRNCNKGSITGFQTTCYADFAVFTDGTLTYITGDSTGQPVTINTPLADWTYVYLPTTFKFKATLNNTATAEQYDEQYGSCRFPLNPANGEPYSIANPPAGGWAAAPISYECVAITADQY